MNHKDLHLVMKFFFSMKQLQRNCKKHLGIHKFFSRSSLVISLNPFFNKMNDFLDQYCHRLSLVIHWSIKRHSFSTCVLRDSTTHFVGPSVGPLFFSAFLSFLGSGLLASNQPPSHALNLPPRPQICPPDLKSALQTFNQPSKLKTSLPNLKSALQALIMPSNPQICLQWHKSAI